jgi:hypothetical protein
VRSQPRLWLTVHRTRPRSRTSRTVRTPLPSPSSHARWTSCERTSRPRCRRICSRCVLYTSGSFARRTRRARQAPAPLSKDPNLRRTPTLVRPLATHHARQAKEATERRARAEAAQRRKAEEERECRARAEAEKQAEEERRRRSGDPMLSLVEPLCATEVVEPKNTARAADDRNARVRAASRVAGGRARATLTTSSMGTLHFLRGTVARGGSGRGRSPASRASLDLTHCDGVWTTARNMTG